MPPPSPPLALQLDKGLRGCFVYTSSAAAMIPNPFSVLYASTKSFLSSFGASLAAEVWRRGCGALTHAGAWHWGPLLAHIQLFCCGQGSCKAGRGLLACYLPCLQVRPYGIDVLVFHPSPVASRFYDKVGVGIWPARWLCCACDPCSATKHSMECSTDYL